MQAGVSPSVGICIDTYSGTSPNYIASGVYINGNVPQTLPTSQALGGIPITNGQWYTFSVSYRQATGTFSYAINGNG